MGLRGELGHVQLSEKDERPVSGPVLRSSLHSICITRYRVFFVWSYPVAMVQRSGGQISTEDRSRDRHEPDGTYYALADDTILNDPSEIVAGIRSRPATDYPDHGFVIDLTEASEFLDHARELDPLERALEEAVAGTIPAVYYPTTRHDIVTCLTASHAVTVHPDLDEEETLDEGLPKDPEGDSGEAAFEDPGVRSPSREADGPNDPSDISAAPGAH